MASFEVLPGSLPSGDYSFLTEVSTTPVPNGDVAYHNDSFNLTNMQSALSAPRPDSSVEVYAQLLELLAENKSLKEKLEKNNAMMEEQMSTISAWREHMMLSKEQQQQSYESAKKKISVLEKENTELLEKIDTMAKATQKETVPSCTKCTIFENGLNNALAIDAAEDAESILMEITDFRENLPEYLTTLCHHMEALPSSKLNEEDKRILKTYILLLKFKISALEGGNFRATVQTDEEPGYEVINRKRIEDKRELLRDVEELRKIIDVKDSELNLLKNEKEKLCEKIKECEGKIQEWEMSLKAQFELMNNKLAIETSNSEKYKERCECLEQQIEEYQAKLDKMQKPDDHALKELHKEIEDLKQCLKIEQLAYQKEKEKRDDVLLKCENLQVDYDRVSKLLEIQTKDEKEKNEELTLLKKAMPKANFEKIDQLTAQIFEMEEQLRECNAKVRELESELAAANEERENIPILRAQIEVYKKDFEVTEAAKNAAAGEMEKLRNELQKYEKKNDPSLDKSLGSVPKVLKNGLFASGKDQKDEIAVCPFCQEQFRNERSVYHHMNRVHSENLVST